MEERSAMLKRLEHERYLKDRERRIAYAKAWNKAHPEKCREYYKKSYYGKKLVQAQKEEEKKAKDPVMTRLLGPPVFIYHGKGEVIKFN
jgi:hypothetical protein